MSVPPTQQILARVERYYTERLRQHGPTARGVDWNSEASQELRFDRLLQVVDAPDGSVLDVGCGYGALLETMRRRGLPHEYRGYDISPAMIAAAEVQHAHTPGARFGTDLSRLAPAAYVVASGIFNVKLETAAGDWQAYVEATLDTMHEAATSGFAFNMLSTYSDADKRRDTLYYADPCAVFDRCKRRYSPRVALWHDYPLYEFTIVVRK